QVAQWVRQTMLAEGVLPKLQVLGIEQMTRQSAIAQNHFLRSLEKVEALLPRLNTSLLVWVPWPWLRTIQQSAPTFWDWRNGLFEFVSDPTPTQLGDDQPPVHEEPANEETTGEEAASEELTARLDNRDHALSAASSNGNQSQPQIDTLPTPHTTISSWSSEIAADPQDQSGGLYGELGSSYSSVAESVAEIEEHAKPRHQELAVVSSATPALERTEQADTEPVTEPINVEVEVVTESDDTTTDTLSVPASAGRHFEHRRRALDAMGGLRSIVSQGINADKPEEAGNGYHFDIDGEPVISEPIISEPVISEPVISEPGSELANEPVNEPVNELMAELAAGLATELADNFAAELANETTLSPSPAEVIPQTPPTNDRQSAADDYFAVGMVYRARIENGERSLELIELAIAAYEGGLSCLQGPHPEWGSGLNDLGTLYWLKAQQLADQQQCVDCMVHSIQLYQEALTKIAAADPLRADSGTASADSSALQLDIVGQLYSNMGAVYSMLAAYENPINYLKQAADTYHLALPLYSLESDPQEYATLQNSLGSVYWKLSHYDAVETHLHRAISAYNEALLGYVPAQQPLDYAAVQNNLGITYWSLAKHERAVFFLKHAIAAYRDALNYRTPEVDPAASAITYNNLALAYWDLSKEGEVDIEHKSRYQKNAIKAFEAALNIGNATQSLNQPDMAAIYHCLGDVHAQMADTVPSLTDVADGLQKSLYSYLQAIDGLPSNSPLYQGRLDAIIANLRAHYDRLGLTGQQAALNRIPPLLLSQVMLSL
ncbi:MAG: tetratricopeptide repeat protein, partial [Phormidesmis sp.]